jgi:protein gp37
MEYAIARQRHRRNLTRHEFNSYVAHVVRASDRHKANGAGARNLIASGDAVTGKSAAALGAQLGVSTSTIERTRAVLASEDEDLKDQLLAGEIAPRAAYDQVRRIEVARADSAPIMPPAAAPEAPQLQLFHPPTKAPASYSVEAWAALPADERTEAIAVGRTFESALNKQDTDNIEWAKWSWNPITGCLHDCPYCYARDIANRFYAQKFAPTFLPGRLGAPAQQRVPLQAEHELGYRNVFTCSMADLFGKWVPSEWIEAVLQVIHDSPQWNFLLLTKFPNRLAEFEYPPNAWLGTSVDCQARVKNAERSFAKVRGGVKWLSIEPLLEPLHFDSLAMFNWVVIGGASASTETPAWIPPRRWILDLECAAKDASCMIYEKTNLGISGPSRLREYPGWQAAEPQLPPALAYLPSIGKD